MDDAWGWVHPNGIDQVDNYAMMQCNGKITRAESEGPLGKGERDDVTIGMAWYRPDQWDALLMISGDSDELEATFREWEENASVQYEGLRKAGIDIQKVDVNLPELVAWCKARGVPVDSDSRSEFAADKLRMLDGASD